MDYHLPQQYRTNRELDLRDAVCPYCLQHKEGFHLMTRTWEKHYHHPENTKQKCKFVHKINVIHVKRGMSRCTLSHTPPQTHTHTHKLCKHIESSILCPGLYLYSVTTFLEIHFMYLSNNKTDFNFKACCVLRFIFHRMMFMSQFYFFMFT